NVIEPTFVEASVTPLSSIDSRKSVNEASSQTKGVAGKRSHSSKFYLVRELKGRRATWRFDQKACRKGLAQMNVIDELPFKLVESEGFRKNLFVTCPRFHIPSRTTMTSHKGESIGIVIEKCLLNWGIDKLLIVTVDNALLRTLRELLRDWRSKIQTLELNLKGEKSNIDVDFSVMVMKMKDNEMSNAEKAYEMMQKLKESLYELSDEYKPPLHNTCSQSSMRELENDGKDKTSELDKYLAEANENFVQDFDILLWWKVNSPKFPTFSKMTKDVLAIPISTIATDILEWVFVVISQHRMKAKEFRDKEVA
ncbi:hypothetical protein Gotri_027040, partial [Gossypium trilobum]|nr:hypothetical protein [Gossypium trilobum]